MSAIGGYFELELSSSGEFHKSAFAINTGRNALQLILFERGYKKVFVPFYTCDAVLEPIVKLNIQVEYYEINSDLEIDTNLLKLESNEVLIYTNYFGLKTNYCQKLSTSYKNVIVDNAQAFFASPTDGIDTFYSARKFFGVSDGAYLYAQGISTDGLSQDKSANRYNHLLERSDYTAESGYLDYQQNEELLSTLEVKRMSNLTQAILAGIDYDTTARIRRENFGWLHNKLGISNRLSIDLSDEAVPMVYPYWINNGVDLRKKLNENQVYSAKYWPNKNILSEPNSLSAELINNLVALPIDQRYGVSEMSKIVDLIEGLC